MARMKRFLSSVLSVVMTTGVTLPARPSMAYSPAELVVGETRTLVYDGLDWEDLLQRLDAGKGFGIEPERNVNPKEGPEDPSLGSGGETETDGPGSADEFEPVGEPGPGDESESVDEPGLADESESVDEPGPGDESESVDEPGLADESESVDEPGLADETEPEDEPGPADESEPEDEPGPADEPEAAHEPDPAESEPVLGPGTEVIVRYRRPQRATLSGMGMEKSEAELDDGAVLMTLEPGADVDAVLEELRQDPNVVYAEPNYILSAVASEPTVPTDDLFDEQWWFNEVGAYAGWVQWFNILDGEQRDPALVTVAVIDTGVDTTHEDLQGRLLPGRNTITGAPDPSDVTDDAYDGHGTHVTGIIAATANNDVGIAGLAGDYPIKILPVKALGADGYGTMYDVARAIEWAADNGAQIINLSLGAELPDYPRTLAEAVRSAQEKGVLLIAAAGNGGDYEPDFYPAALPDVVKVGATDEEHNLADFSNTFYHTVMAPGVDIISTLPGNQYGARTGTSASAPIATAVAALGWSLYPDKSAADVADALYYGTEAHYDHQECSRYSCWSVYDYVLHLLAFHRELTESGANAYDLELLEPEDGARVSGTVRITVRVGDPEQIHHVVFNLWPEGAEEPIPVATILGRLADENADRGGLFTLEWDSTEVADGAYEWEILTYGGASGEERLSWEYFDVYVVNDQVLSGLTLQIYKPDGGPAAGAPVRVYHYVSDHESWEPEYEVVDIGSKNADLDGKLLISGGEAFDGNDYFVVTWGTEPDFVYARTVRAPASVTLDATDAQPVTFVADTVEGDPLGGATLLIEPLPEVAQESPPGPWVTLKPDGTRLVHVTEGAYNLRLTSEDSAYFLHAQGVTISDGTDEYVFDTDETAVTRIDPRPDGEFYRVDLSVVDPESGDFVLGPIKGSTPVTVTNGTYLFDIEAVVRKPIYESDPNYGYEWTHVLRPTVTASGGSMTLEFGGPLQVSFDYASDATEQVEKGDYARFAIRTTDAHDNILSNLQWQLYRNGKTEGSKNNSLHYVVLKDEAGTTLRSNTTATCSGTYYLDTYNLNPGTYQVFLEFNGGPLLPEGSDPMMLGPLSLTVVNPDTPPEPSETLIKVLDPQGNPVTSGLVGLFAKWEEDYYPWEWLSLEEDGAAHIRWYDEDYDIGADALALAVIGFAPMTPEGEPEPFFLLEPIEELAPRQTITITTADRSLSRVELQILGPADTDEEAEPESGIQWTLNRHDSSGLVGGIRLSDDYGSTFSTVWLEHGKYSFIGSANSRWGGNLYQVITPVMQIPNALPPGGILSWSAADMSTITARPPKDTDTAHYGIGGIAVLHPDFPWVQSPVFTTSEDQKLHVLPGKYLTYTAVAQGWFDRNDWTYWFEREVEVGPNEDVTLEFDVDLTVWPVQLDQHPAVYRTGDYMLTTHLITNQRGDRLWALHDYFVYGGGMPGFAFVPGVGTVMLSPTGEMESQNHDEIAPFLVLTGPDGREALRLKDPGSLWEGLGWMWRPDETVPVFSGAGTYEGAVVSFTEEMPGGVYTAHLELGAGHQGLIKGDPVSFKLIAPPPPPVLNEPGRPTKEATAVITGTAVPDAEVVLSYRLGDGELVEAGRAAAAEDRSFSIEVSVPDEGTYTFTAVAILDSLTSLSPSAEVVLVVDRTAPGAPVELTWTSPDMNHISLIWKAPVGEEIAAYIIQREGSDPVTLPATETTYLDGGLEANTAYRYTVKAVDLAGNESEPAAVTATTSATADVEPPTAPQGLAVALQNGVAVLTWNASSDNVAVMGYAIYRATGQDEPVRLGEVGADTLTYSDRNLDPETAYTYTVTALDEAGNESQPSNAASVTTESVRITNLTWKADLLNGRTLKPGGNLTVTLRGDRNMTAAGMVTYRVWADDSGAPLAEPETRTAPIVLPETEPGSGIYVGTLQLSQYVAWLDAIRVTLDDGKGHTASRDAYQLPVGSAGILEVKIQLPDGVSLEDAAASLQGSDLIAVSTRSAGYQSVDFSDTLLYTLPGLVPETDYRVYLQTKGGLIVGEVKDVAVNPGLTTKTVLPIQLPASLDVSLEGTDLPAVGVAVVDSETGEIVHAATLTDKHRSFRRTGLLAGSELRVQFTVPVGYRKVAERTITLKPDENRLSVPIEKQIPGIVRGVAKDQEGKPLADVTVTVNQRFPGRSITNWMKTGADGSYSFEVLPGAFELSASHSYRFRAPSGLTGTVDEAETVIMDLPFAERQSTRVDIALKTRYSPDDAWQDIDVTNWRDAAHYHVTSRNASTYGWKASGASPQFVEAAVGDEIEVCADGLEAGLQRNCVRVSVREDLTASATVYLEQYGGTIRIAAVNQGGSSYDGEWEATVYKVHSDGVRQAVRRIKSSDSRVDVPVSEEGRYQVSALAEGLSGESAVVQVSKNGSRTLTVRLGGETSFQGADENGVSASTTEISPGSTITFRARYQNTSDTTLTGAVIRLEIPSETTLAANSVVKNGKPVEDGTASTAAYELSLGNLEPGASGWVSWQVRLADTVEAPYLAPAAWIRHDDRNEPELLGNALVEVVQISLKLPAITSERVVRATGRAPADSVVRLYDGDLLIGTAQATPTGTWSMDIQLGDGELGTAAVSQMAEDHYLRVQAMNSQGDMVGQTMSGVRYDPDHPELRSITMQRAVGNEINGSVTAYPSRGVARFPFVYVPGQAVTFSLDFNNPGRVHDVKVRIAGDGGGKASAQGGRTASIRVGSGLGPVYVSYKTKPSVWSPPTVQPPLSSIQNGLPDGRQWDGVSWEIVEQQNSSGTDGSESFARLSTVAGSARQASVTLKLTKLENWTPSPEQVAEAASTGGPTVYNLTTSVTDGSVSIRAYIPLDQFPGAAKSMQTQARTVVITEMHINHGLAVADLYGVIMSGVDYKNKMAELEKLLDESANCGTRGSDYYRSRIDDLAKDLLTSLVVKYAVQIGGMALTASGIGFVGGLAVWGLGNLFQIATDIKWENQLARLKMDMQSDPSCEGHFDDMVMDPEWILDPSGFVYEAVESNRLSDVTTTILFRNTDGTWTVWDAEWYGQKNPLLTDEEGRYAWDVPPGDWQVIYEKDGYERAASEVLTVPPIHLDVNQGMLSLADPTVEAIIPVEENGTRAIEVQFSQYMLIDTLTEFTIGVARQDATLLEGYVAPVSAPDDWTLARAARFVPDTPFEPETDYIVTVSAGVQNYRGWPMVDPVTETIMMPADLTSPAAVRSVRVESGDEELVVTWTDPGDDDLAGVLVEWQGVGESGSRNAAPGVERVVLGDLTNGAVYWVTLTAYDGSNNKAQPVSVSGTPLDLTPPGKVTGVKITPLAVGEVGLTWNDPAGAEFVRITWSDSTGMGESAAVHAGVEGYVVRGLTPLTTYTFTLVAVDDSGNASDAVSVDYTEPGDELPPADVTNVQVLPGVRKLTLTWVDPASPGLRGILLSWGTNGNFGEPVEVAAGTQTYTITGLQAGVEYAVKLAAVNTRGQESAGFTVTGTPRSGSSGGGSSGGGRDDDSDEPPVTPEQPGTPEPEPEPGPEPESEPEPEPEPEDSGITLGDPNAAAEALDERPTTDLPGLRPISPIYRLTATGSTPPTVPISASFQFDPDLLGGADVRKLGIYRRGSWIYVGGTVDAAEGQVHGQLPGFGDYALMLYDRTFADLQGHWGRTDVEVLAARHLVNGVTETTFEPDRTITRAELAKLLAAMLGEQPTAPAAATFKDVAPGAWYYSCVETAARLGLVKGSDGLFRPDDPVTREEMAAMVLRALGLEERAAQMQGDPPFSDGEAISTWAKGYVTLAAQEGLMKGMPDGTFQPQGTATRAEAAALILRAMTYLGLVTR